MSKIYLLLGGEQQGPYSEEEVRDMYRAGTVTADTPHWSEGMPDWKVLGPLNERSAQPGVNTIAPPRRTAQSSSAQVAAPGKEKHRPPKDLSARSQPITVAKAAMLLILFFFVLSAVIMFLCIETPDPGKVFAERVEEMLTHK